MRKRLVTLAFLSTSVFSTAGLAQDWSGFYVGAHAGYGWADWDGYIGTTAGAPPGVTLPGVDSPDQSLSDEGFLGGAQVGFNWQLPSRIVLGVEADISWADIDASGTFDATSGASVWRKPHDLSLDYFGTARVRVGYAAGNLLPYVTGGFAWGETSGDLAVEYIPPAPRVGGTSYASVDETHFGWTIGGGIEWAVTKNISLKAEYLHIDLGTEDYLFKGTTYHGTPPEFETDSFKSELTVDTVRVGLNYKLGDF